MSDRGKGSLRELGKDRWEIRLSLGKDPVTGEYRRLSRTFHGTEKQALREMERLRKGQVVSGQVTDMTCAELVARHLADLAVRGRSPSTLEGYERLARSVIKDTIGPTPIGDLTVKQLDDLYQAETARGMSASSVRQVNAVISGALTMAGRKGWLGDRPVNVATYATKPAKPGRSVQSPPTQAVKDLYQAAVKDESQERALALAVVAETGARRGEVCGFRWTDLDDDSIAVARNVIRVKTDIRGSQLPSTNRTYGKTRTPRYVLVKSLKVDRPRRIGLSPDLLLELTLHRARMEQRSELFEMPIADDAYIFSDDPDQARPWHPAIISETVTRLRRRYGITAARLLHGMRHHAATNMLAAGIDPAVGAQRLGHSSTKMFLDTYADATPARDQDAAALLRRRIFGAS